MVVVLMVAEKPSLAESLAKILSNGRYKSRKGLNGACSVHEYHGSFLRHQEVTFKFTSVCGHVMSVDFPGKYNNWDRVEPRELFEASIIKKEANPNLKMPKFLETEAKNAQYLVLWLDCDKEGENICFEVIQAVERVMKISFDHPQTVFRARFSAITDKDIKNAMRNLVLPNYLESLSVDARQELDLRAGCAFTRFQTRFFHGKYGDLDSALISFGPCQTPTLGFCVDRHDKIQSFQPEPYWVIIVNVGLPEKGLNFNLDWDREREFNQNTAKSLLNKVKAYKKAMVTNITHKEKSKPRPSALNTVELLRVASSGLGIGPHQAMSVAERLYTQGYLSYPRTETTQYPANFDLNGTLRLFSGNSVYGNEVQSIFNRGISRPKSGHDAGDHPPITPMRSATRDQISDSDAWRVYDYVVRHFMGTLAGDCKYEQTTVKFSIGDEKFTKNGAIVLEPGFTEVMPWLALPTDQKLSSSLSVGDEFLIGEIRLDERHTSPPDYLSEADLISLMEKHGIGTDASIPTHINNICVRNYVKIASGRRLIPTKLGIVLVHGYQKIDSELVLPTSRAALEKKLNQICHGTADFDQVLRSSLTEFTRKFDNFVQNITAMDELFEVSFSSLAESGKPLSRCGKCRRYLKIITAKPVRLYCPNCNETLSLPPNGNFRTFKELKCPVDQYEILYYTAFGENAKSYLLCPHCYNNPPFEDMRKASGCNACPNKECPQSMIAQKISDCKTCTWEGSMILDSASGVGGGKWKIFCNKCDAFISGLKDATKVVIQPNKTCEKCSSRLIHTEFKKDKEPVDGCIFCNPELTGLLYFGTQRRGGGGDRSGRGGYQKTQNSSTRERPDRAGKDSVPELENDFQRMTFNDDGGHRGGRSRGRGRGSGRGTRGSRGTGRSRGRGSGRGRGRGGRNVDHFQYDNEGYSAPRQAEMKLADFM